MIIEEIKNVKSTEKELRQFGIVMAIVFGLLGVLFLWRHNSCYSYFFVISAVFFFFGITLPIILKPIQKIWVSIAILMGYVMLRVILSILFFLVFTPTGLATRLFSKQLLDLKIERGKKSYWNHRRKKESNYNNYEKQF